MPFPLGAAPLIEDGDLLLAESAAIVEYIIVKRQGRLLIFHCLQILVPIFSPTMKA
jgi:glutathione S-transferase